LSKIEDELDEAGNTAANAKYAYDKCVAEKCN